MALEFPSSPTTGQTYINGNLTWKWSGTAWDPVGTQVTSTVVVSTPVFNTPSQATVGQTVLVKASSQALLANATITSYRITVPSGTSTVAANLDGSGQLSFVTSGSVNDVITVKAQAIDSYNNASITNTYNITLSTAFVNQATITSPVNLATNVFDGFAISTAAFASTGASDTLNRTEFEILDAGSTVLWSASAVGALTTTVATGVLSAGATIYLRARHVGNTLGYGQWSSLTQVTLEPVLTPVNYGDPYQGGYYAGRITMSGNRYAIVVAPVSTETTLAGATNTTTGTLTTGARSLFDGAANTNDLILNSTTFWPAASYCYNLSLNGYSDWYLPSLMELELAYRTLKPTDALNSIVEAYDANSGPGFSIVTTPTTWTGNLNNEWGYASATMTSVPAGGATYTNTSVGTVPALTTSTIFQSSLLQQAFASDTYWSSSAVSSAAANRENLGYFRFTDGYSEGTGNATGAAMYSTQVRRVRPFRRVFLGAV